MPARIIFKAHYLSGEKSKHGNVVSTVDIAKTNSTFAYYGNQMAKMLNPSGSKYMYSYNDKKQLYKALSSDGQEYGFSYDDKGNVTKAEIVARKPATTIESGKEYILVNAYSGKAMDSGNTGNISHPTTTYLYSPSASYQHWKVELYPGKTDVYSLKAVSYSDRYLDVKGGGNGQGTPLQTYSYNGQAAQQFKIVKKQDNTFALFTGCSNYTKALDAQLDTGDVIIPSQTVKQANCNPDSLPEGMRWYFYPVEKSEDKTIVTETTYTDSKNFVKSTKDQRGNETTYAYNEQKGTLTSTTDALGRTTSYTYDPNNNSLLSVSSGGMTNSYAYENDRLKTITVNGGLRYAFEYDAFGRTTNTKVGNGTNFKTLSSLEYNDKGLLGKQTYGNGDYIDFTYDNLDRITEKKYNGDINNRAVYRYGNDGSLAQTIDFSTGTRTKFTYDLADRLVSQKEYTGTGNNGGTLRSSTDFTYADKTNYLTGVKHFSPLGTQNISYTYGDMNQGQMPDRVYKISWTDTNKGAQIQQDYDSLGRLGMRVCFTDNLNMLINRYRYVNVGEDKTTTLLEAMRTEVGTYSYTYDAVGNITSVSLGEEYTNSYEYDALNQLIRENNGQIGKTYTYTYVNGNITERKEYAYTTGELGEVLDTKTWSYTDNTWTDLLTECNWKTISYDEIGNPTTIGSQSLSWNGRQLQEITDSENTYTYLYNTDGQRVSKVVNGVTTEYFYNGSILAGQKTGNDTLVFMYDNNGDYFGFTYNGEAYYYVKNAQNDVVAILDSNKTVIAEYTYDAWGNCTVSSKNWSSGSSNGWIQSEPINMKVSLANPIRYRSYYFDSETNFYYLNSRYYSPEMCRFLNADGVIGANQDIHAYNLFAYCSNNPINFCDPSGCYTITIPAEGNEFPPIVERYPWEPEVSIDKVGDTYIATPSSNLPNALDIAALAGVSIGDELVTNYFDGIYVAQREITYRAANNVLIRTFVPKHPSLVRAQNYSKTVGVVSTIAFVFDLGMDLHHYGLTKDFGKAAVVTTVMTAIGIGVGIVGGAIVAAELAPAIAVGFAVGIVGVGLSFAEDAWKTKWIGY